MKGVVGGWQVLGSSRGALNRGWAGRGAGSRQVVGEGNCGHSARNFRIMYSALLEHRAEAVQVRPARDGPIVSHQVRRQNTLPVPMEG